MAQPKTIPFDQPATIPFAASTPTQPDTRDWLQKAGDFVTGNNLPGSQLGSAIGNSINGIVQSVKQGSLAPALEAGAQNNKNMGKIVGDTARSAILPASLAASAPASFAGAVGQYGAFGAAQSGAESLSKGDSLSQATTQAAIGGAVGAATGGIFNLAGRGINYAVSKTAPTAASVTSGVPKAAIEQASVNPSAVKEGIHMNVSEVRNKATASLQTLQNDLVSEFKAGTEGLSDVPPQNARDIASSLIQNAQNIAKKFKVDTTTGLGGLTGDFSKSAIVKGGEEAVVNKALQTVSTWSDFSEKGLQALNQRVNALKNFDEAGVTKSSAIVGELHNAISNAIEKASPALATINKNFSTNQKVLDEIGNVIGSNAKTPTQIQASVNRLDTMFRQNKDEYINVIKQLGERSGVDYLSLLAGGEFQNLLPNYIRSAVAVGSVGGIGTIASNPMSLLLLPLFSPRAVGFAARNAPAAAKATSQIVRAGATQAIPKIGQSAVKQ